MNHEEFPKNVPVVTWFGCVAIVLGIIVGLASLANARHISDVIRPGELLIVGVLLLIYRRLGWMAREDLSR